MISAHDVKMMDLACDREYSIYESQLMEMAGVCVFNEIRKRFPSVNQSVFVLVGIGNNGGDGLVCARYLINYGYRVTVLLVKSSQYFSGINSRHLDCLRKMGAKIYVLNEGVSRETFGFADVVVDALFGVGLDRRPSGVFASAISFVNLVGGFVVSVDVASGVDVSRETVDWEVVEPFLTVTFVEEKVKAAVGEVVVGDIGVPRSLSTFFSSKK